MRDVEMRISRTYFVWRENLSNVSRLDENLSKIFRSKRKVAVVVAIRKTGDFPIEPQLFQFISPFLVQSS